MNSTKPDTRPPRMATSGQPPLETENVIPTPDRPSASSGPPIPPVPTGTATAAGVPAPPAGELADGGGRSDAAAAGTDDVRAARQRRLQDFFARHAAPTSAATVSVPKEILELAGPGLEPTLLFGTVHQEPGGPCLLVEDVVSVRDRRSLVRLGVALPPGADGADQAGDIGLVVRLGDPPEATVGGRPVRLLVHDAARFHARVEGLPLARAVRGRTAVLVGAGSVGSRFVAPLAALGVSVVLVDPDRLEVENLVRWGLVCEGRRHLGRLKTAVLADLVRRAVPGADVHSEPLDVVTEAPRFLALLERVRPDLVVVTTDTHDSRILVNSATAPAGIPTLYVGFADRAESVRIELVTATTACHLCSLVAEGGLPDEVRAAGRASGRAYAVDPEAGAAAVSALGVDVSLGTAFAVKVALEVLAGGDGIDALFTHGEQRGNVQFVSCRADHPIFSEVFGRLVYAPDALPDCPACGGREPSATAGSYGG